MRRILLVLSFGIILAVGLHVAAPAQAPSAAPSGYLTPPKVISDIMDAEPLPGVALAVMRGSPRGLSNRADNGRGCRLDVSLHSTALRVAMS